MELFNFRLFFTVRYARILKRSIIMTHCFKTENSFKCKKKVATRSNSAWKLAALCLLYLCPDEANMK